MYFVTKKVEITLYTGANITAAEAPVAEYLRLGVEGQPPIKAFDHLEPFAFINLMALHHFSPGSRLLTSTLLRSELIQNQHFIESACIQLYGTPYVDDGLEKLYAIRRASTLHVVAYAYCIEGDASSYVFQIAH